MNILIIGGGGREHALAWKIAQSPRASKVYVAPGNAGTAHENKVENIDIAAEDIDTLLAFAKNNAVDLTIVGPEVPLVLGIVDRFRDAGLRCFGPSQAAAQLEGSKTFTKDFLKQFDIPTAAYQSFTDASAAISYIKQQGTPIVIKADGLAAGKGVILAQSEVEAIAAVEDMLSSNVFGEAGHRVVVEEFLLGEETSFICMVDGEHILPLATSQDHKARDNGDKGPNTGGMGAYSPAPVVTEAIHKRIMAEVIEPTVKGMAENGHPYTGFLYAGVMIGEDGVPRVLEYNCRFGDPETQPILLRLRSDLIELVEAALDGKLDTVKTRWDPRPALGVVMAAGGYPEQYNKGNVITGSQQDYGQDIKVFHAGTASDNSDTVTNGGRVLCVTALGDDVADARQRAYKTVEKIRWKDAYYRTDIGYRAIDRQS